MSEVEAGTLRLQAMTLPSGQPAAQAFIQETNSAQAAASRHKSEKDTIETAAHHFEAERDDATRRGKPFGVAVIFLQVAILLNSMAALFKTKRVWFLAVPVGLAGITFFANGSCRSFETQLPIIVDFSFLVWRF